MKSIATELVSDFIYNKIHNLYVEEIIIKAKAHALTCQTILDRIKNFPLCKHDYCEESQQIDELEEWCESEIKILKKGGLI